jgi:hypothetical protein
MLIRAGLVANKSTLVTFHSSAIATHEIILAVLRLAQPKAQEAPTSALKHKKQSPRLKSFNGTLLSAKIMRSKAKAPRSAGREK